MFLTTDVGQPAHWFGYGFDTDLRVATNPDASSRLNSEHADSRERHYRRASASLFFALNITVRAIGLGSERANLDRNPSTSILSKMLKKTV